MTRLLIKGCVLLQKTTVTNSIALNSVLNSEHFDTKYAYTQCMCVCVWLGGGGARGQRKPMTHARFFSNLPQFPAMNYQLKC